MDYKQRLVQELNNLSIKIGKLEAFIDNQAIENPTNDIEKHKFELQHRQLDLMFSYADVLMERICVEMRNN